MSLTVKRLFDIPYYQLEHYPQEDALAAKVDGNWVKTNTQSYVDQANLFSKGLLKLGIEAGDKIAMISNNRPEWNMTDVGILQIGAINVPVYPTLSDEDCTFVFNDAEVTLCIVSDQELYEKINKLKPEIPSLKEIYTYDTVAGAKNWTEILELGKDGDQEEVEKRKEKINENDLATLIYTSGTTGTPKGVMLSHSNIVSNVLGCMPRLPVDSEGKGLSFLPLCHVYERMIIYLYQYAGVSLYYAESMDTIGDNIREVQPDVFTAVPRLLEKVYDKIMTRGAALTGIKKALFYWAVKLGTQYDIKGKSAWYHFKLKIARKLIFSKWQQALGGRVKAIASGSAALQPRLICIFLAAGVPIREGYGLTETSPVCAVNCADDDGIRIGTVGRALEDVSIKIADDGEILVKGPNVMMGYYKRPDLTKEVMNEEGYFHTGDIGELVEGEFLKITDRKKEIFKTSGGKYVAPQVLENVFKESRFIEQVMVIGEGQKHPAAFVQPEFEFLRNWCERKGIHASSNEEIIRDEQVIARIKKELDHYNERFGRWEQVKKFKLTADIWSIEEGHLTPTLKLRRKIILKKYQNLYNEIYGS